MLVFHRTCSITKWTQKIVVSELGYIIIEIWKQRDKGWKKETWGHVEQKQRSKNYVIGVLKEAKRRLTEKRFEETMVKNFPNLEVSYCLHSLLQFYFPV